MRALKDGPVLVRMAAAEALGRLGTTAREAIPRLLEALRTERIDDVRQKTREALTLLLGRKR